LTRTHDPAKLRRGINLAEEIAMRESMGASRGFALGSRVIALALMVAMLLPWTPRVSAEETAADPEKAKLVRQLITMTGSNLIGAQVTDALLQQFRQTFTTVPPEYWTELRKSIKTEELVELIVPVYSKSFTAPELEELIGFYESPIGKKVIATLPKISQESMIAGQDWGKKKATEILEKLKKDGYTPPQGT
jgi:uncharacterized protein